MGSRTHDGDDGVAQDGGHTANRSTDTCSLGFKRPSLILDIRDIGHPCQLTPVKKRYILKVYFEIIQTHNRRSNNIQRTSLQSNKTQIEILAYPGLA